MGKKLFSLCMALVLCLSLLPATALAADGATVYVVSVELKGSKEKPAYATTNADTGAVTTEGADENNYNIMWDGETLTLRNAAIKQAGVHNNESIAVYLASGNMNLVLVGKNTVEAPDSESVSSCGIHVGGNLTIKGQDNGSLSVSGGDSGGSSYGIHAFDTITINSGSVNATSGEAQGDSCGIFAEDENYRYQNSITINGGTVIATAGDAVGTGWYSCGIRVEGPITITGGTVNVMGKTSTKKVSCGIYAVQSVNISGGTVTATGGTAIKGKSGGISATNTIADVEVTIEDAAVTATGGSAGTGSYGILAETTGTDKSADVTINGNSVVRANMTDVEDVDGEPISGNTIKKENSIVFENGDGTVYGTVTLREDLTVGADESLTIPQDAALTIPDGTTLTSSGVITNEGTIDNQGTLTIGQGGALTGKPVTGNPLTYAVTVLTDGNGTASASGTSAAADDTVTLTATPDSGSHFERWEVVSGGVTIENNTFIMPSQPVTVRAVFDRNSSGPTRYAVTAPDVENGTVRVSPSRAARGTTVTITVTADEGYELERLTVLDSRDGEIALTDEGDGKYTFTMPAGRVTVAASFVESAPEPLPFDDVDDGDWFADAVRFVYENGMMNGTGDTTFAPDATTSRSMIVTILYRLEGEPVVDYAMDFTDVAGDAYYAEAVRWAASEGIVGGYGGGLFGSDDAVTREQLAVILYRYAVYKGYDVSIGEDTNILSYDDFADLSEYAIPAMQWACGAGIITGVTDATLVPQGEATRAQVAAMLMRFVEAIG